MRVVDPSVLQMPIALQTKHALITNAKIHVLEPVVKTVNVAL